MSNSDVGSTVALVPTVVPIEVLLDECELIVTVVENVAEELVRLSINVIEVEEGSLDVDSSCLQAVIDDT